MPHGPAAARQPAPLDPPCSAEVACQLPREVMPDALAPRRGTDVPRGADESVMDVDMLRGVVRVRDRRQQELAESAFPYRVPVDHFVGDDEHRSGHRGQHHGHQGDLPGDHVADHEHLPQGEYERHRPEQRPQPHRQNVPEQAPFRGMLRINVPFVRAEPCVQPARDPAEDKGKCGPPAAVNRGVDHEGQDRQGEEVRERVAEGGLDRSRSFRREGARITRLGRTMRHGDLPSSSDLPVLRERRLSLARRFR